MVASYFCFFGSVVVDFFYSEDASFLAKFWVTLNTDL